MSLVLEISQIIKALDLHLKYPKMTHKVIAVRTDLSVRTVDRYLSNNWLKERFGVTKDYPDIIVKLELLSGQNGEAPSPRDDQTPGNANSQSGDTLLYLKGKLIQRHHDAIRDVLVKIGQLGTFPPSGREIFNWEMQPANEVREIGGGAIIQRDEHNNVSLTIPIQQDSDFTCLNQHLGRGDPLWEVIRFSSELMRHDANRRLTIFHVMATKTANVLGVSGIEELRVDRKMHQYIGPLTGMLFDHVFQSALNPNMGPIEDSQFVDDNGLLTLSGVPILPGQDKQKFEQVKRLFLNAREKFGPLMERQNTITSFEAATRNIEELRQLVSNHLATLERNNGLFAGVCNQCP